MERYVAVDNVCAWPNLTLLANGEIAATVFNQPCHGAWEGDVECWVSADGGHLWERRGALTAREPNTVRMNHAAGLACDGSLVALVSGWSHKAPRGVQPPPGTSRVLEPWVCCSSDGGRTWRKKGDVTTPRGLPGLIPFGDIVQSPDGALAAAFYSWDVDKRVPDNAVYLLWSRDDGLTWGDASLLAESDHNETALLCVNRSRWLAAARTLHDQHLDLFVSQDGRTWTCRGPVSLPMQHPAHLLRLADGRILLTYGLRNVGHHGVAVRLSGDEGDTWSAPRVLLGWEERTDSGYPSSVQLADGTIVTAYYASYNPCHHRYHMGVVRWKAEG